VANDQNVPHTHARSPGSDFGHGQQFLET